MMSIRYVSVLSAAAFALVLTAGDTGWEAKRQEILNRKRQIVYNTDGCDITYFPADQEPTAENFVNLRLRYAKDTHIDVISYCVHGSFGMVTYNSKVTDILYGSAPADPKAHWRYRNSRNPMKELIKQGTDALKASVDYGHSIGKEVWASFRMNDRHDQIYKLGEGFLASRFKVRHPDKLMGTRANRPEFAAWNQVDYGQKVVREHMIAMLKEVCDNYDIDGIELDFMRHSALFKSVAYGKKPSRAEIEAMNDFMRQVRANAESAGKKRGRPILVVVRLPDSLEFCNALGIDLETWMKNKYIDIYIGSAYYQLKHWRDSVALAKKYGIKFIASMDESRIGYNEPGVKCLPGRLNGNLPYINARILAAIASGCDGVNHFNTEYEALTRVTKTPVSELEFTDKLYFVSERGGKMGYIPDQNVKNGNSYYKMVRIDPSCNPPVLAPEKVFAFQIMIGDDLNSEGAKKRNPQITIDALAELPAGAVMEFTANGVKAELQKHSGEVFTYKLPASALFKGMNEFTVKSSQTTKLHDVCLKIRYFNIGTAKDREDMKKFADLPITENFSFRVKDGVLDLKGKVQNQYISGKTSILKDESIELIHDTPVSKFRYIHFKGDDMEFMKNPPELVVMEWVSRVIANGPNGESALNIVLAPARKNGGAWESAITFTREKCFVNGKPLSGNFGEFHKFRLVQNCVTGKSALWIDGELVFAGLTEAGLRRKAPFIIFGDGSGSISGKAEVKSMITGSLGAADKQ